MTDLDLSTPLIAIYSGASDINASGQVVGTFDTTVNRAHAFITGPNGVGMTDLGTLGGWASFADAVNDSGQVIGTSPDPAGDLHAFMYSHSGGMIDLSLLLAVKTGWSNHFYPLDINNHGQIVGYQGYPDGPEKAYLLSAAPIPEPQTYAMLLAGLGVLGFMMRRKKESIA